MSPTAADLDPLLAVAVARFDDSGVLQAANAGFLRLIATQDNDGGRRLFGQRADHFFIQPAFAAFAGSAGEGGIYTGLLTLGHIDGVSRTLRGSVRRTADGIEILAEYDIAEMERVGDTVLALNRDYARAQYEVVQANLALQQLKAELERRVIERTHDLADALTRAETANRAKDAFLSTMSHELRTPLQHIMGFADVLRLRLADPKHIQHIERIHAATKHLTELINDILLVAELKAERFDLEFSDFDLPHLVHAIEERMRGPAEAKGLKLRCDIDPALPPHLHGDPQRLGQVLTHLLDNAVKFSPQGLVTLRACLASQKERRRMVRFEIRDEGIGIAAEQQKAIFERFRQVDDSATRAYGGSGLGLAICKQLVLLMGGRIGVDSTPGSGSLFWIEIPSQAAARR
jgi:signal transduction histidine kinase